MLGLWLGIAEIPYFAIGAFALDNAVTSANAGAGFIAACAAEWVRPVRHRCREFELVSFSLRRFRVLPGTRPPV